MNIDLRKEQLSSLQRPHLNYGMASRFFFFGMDLVAGKKNDLPKAKLLEILSWTNENRQYFWEATNCQCYGCIALCGEISDKVFGKYAPVTKHSNFSRIKAGDHIRIGNEHSVMVLQKNGNTLTVVEGNYNATVHWGRKITKKELQESGFYVETRY